MAHTGKIHKKSGRANQLIINGRRTATRRGDIHDLVESLERAKSVLSQRPPQDRIENFQTLIRAIDWQAVHTIIGPREMRAWLELSESEIGLALEPFSGKLYIRSTISSWEKYSTTQSKTNPYKISRRARRAYRALFRALVFIKYGPGYYIKARMWRGPWRLEIKPYRN